MHLKRVFFLGSIVSLSVAAGLGIWVITFGTFDALEGALLATMFAVGLFTLTALGSLTVRERGVWVPVMGFTVALSAVGLAYFLVLIWGALLGGRGSLVARLMPLHGSVAWLIGIWATALTHLGLLSLPRLKGWPRLVRATARWLVLALAGWICVVVVAGSMSSTYLDAAAWWQVLGVLIIMSVLGSLAVPILVRLRGVEQELGAESTEMALTLRCPRCLTEQTVQTGASRCVACRLKFHIQIEEPRCPSCGYLLHQLTEPRCPECGRALDAAELPRPGSRENPQGDVAGDSEGDIAPVAEPSD